MNPNELLAQRFEAVTLAGIQEGKRLFSYNPTRYLMMVRERGVERSTSLRTFSLT